MSLLASTDHSRTEASPYQPSPLPMWLRMAMFVTGVLFPAGCIGLVASGTRPTIDSPWQSGEVKDYAVLLMQFPAIASFLPLFLFSMASLTAWTFRPRSVKFLWVRAGIYAGVPLAVQFLVLTTLTTGLVTYAAAHFVAMPCAVLFFGGRWLIRRMRRFTLWHLMLGMTACAVLAGVIALAGAERIAQYLPLPIIAIAPATPCLNALTYIVAAVLVLRQASWLPYAARWKSIAAIISLAAAWITGWKVAVDLMLVEYSKLPTTDPNCYVSSAAAHGHRRLVRSRSIDEPAAGPIQVNDQMRRLKFLEFALQAAHPRIHGKVRAVYDRFGPRLAAGCRASAYLADGAYLLLKPLEWAAELLRMAASIPGSKVAKLYSRPQRFS
ncbi:MAG: hypothetical protein KDA71_05415 [Planctomycetales bacterium]|nr:hypothetical protein [Planctomycetales bacterium]